MKQTHCNNPSCGKELIHTQGRRPKKYCSVGCRNAHYKAIYKPKKKEFGGIPLPADFIKADKIGILNQDGTVDKIFKWNGREMILVPEKKLDNIIDFKQPVYDGPLLTNITINEPGQWAKPKQPTTLAELKAICPSDLTGLEKSEWLSKKRVEYGI